MHGASYAFAFFHKDYMVRRDMFRDFDLADRKPYVVGPPLCGVKVLWVGEFHRTRTRRIKDACVIALREWNEISDLTG